MQINARQKNTRECQGHRTTQAKHCLHTCESYRSKTHKCDFKVFPDFKVSLKIFLHTCESCQSETYKCAVTRIKGIVERLWILKAPRLYCGATLFEFGRHLAPFSIPLASFLFTCDARGLTLARLGPQSSHFWGLLASIFLRDRKTKQN